MIDKTKNIDSICRKYNIINYTINSDGSIDVNGNVNLGYNKLTKLPLKFNKVSGSFSCYQNQLTSLEGCPIEVGGIFDCHSNKLTSLEGCPKEVGENFSCYNNQLTTLEGGPIKVGGDFYCDRYVNDIEPYIINIYTNIDHIAKIDYIRYRKVNDRDKKINNILT